MTDSEQPDRVKANVDRSRTSIAAARKLISLGYADDAASRAYYAAFHAATAVLLSKGLEFSRHAGLLSGVHKELVRHGLLSKESGNALDRLFRLRLVGDYGAVDHVSTNTARQAVETAAEFVEKALNLLPGDPTEQAEP